MYVSKCELSCWKIHHWFLSKTLSQFSKTFLLGSSKNPSVSGKCQPGACWKSSVDLRSMSSRNSCTDCSSDQSLARISGKLECRRFTVLGHSFATKRRFPVAKDHRFWNLPYKAIRCYKNISCWRKYERIWTFWWYWCLLSSFSTQNLQRSHRTYRISSYPQLEERGVTASMHQRS